MVAVRLPVTPTTLLSGRGFIGAAPEGSVSDLLEEERQLLEKLTQSAPRLGRS